MGRNKCTPSPMDEVNPATHLCHSQSDVFSQYYGHGWMQISRQMADGASFGVDATYENHPRIGYEPSNRNPIRSLKNAMHLRGMEHPTCSGSDIGIVENRTNLTQRLSFVPQTPDQWSVLLRIVPCFTLAGTVHLRKVGITKLNASLLRSGQCRFGA